MRKKLKRLSELTLQQYYYDLRQMFLLLGKTPDKVEERDIIQLFATKPFNDYKIETLARKIIILRQFYNELIKMGLLNNNPVTLEMPRSRSSLAERVIPYKDIERIIKKSKKEGVLEHAVVVTLFNTGMRVSELCGIKLPDVNFDTMTIRIKGKGGGIRSVYVNEEVILTIEKYLDYRDPANRKQDALFLTKTGRNIYSKHVWRILNRIGKKLGIKVSPHYLRHSFAVESLRRGMDFRILQKVLGHKQAQTTARYTEVFDSMVDEAYRRAWEKPKNKE